jgi:hypothetical protein
LTRGCASLRSRRDGHVWPDRGAFRAAAVDTLTAVRAPAEAAAVEVLLRVARVLVSSEIWYLKTQPDFAALIHSFSRSGISGRRRRVTAVIGAGDADLVLAANGGWPAVHICGVPNSSCSSVLAGHAGVRHVPAFAALTFDPLRPADAPAAVPPHRA